MSKNGRKRLRSQFETETPLFSVGLRIIPKKFLRIIPK
jgi:hypothetical protein